MSAMEGCDEIVLFGTRIVVDSMRKTVSFNNLSDYQHVADVANPSAKAAGCGYVSDNVARAGAIRERKRGTPWSEEEHKRFLMGLKKVGKGDWRAISKNFVKTRTPTQVASHAQKYFLRHTTIKSRRRPSLFDITTETFNSQIPGKTSEEKPESVNGNSSSSQLPTTGSSNACFPPMVPALPVKMSPVILVPLTPLINSIPSQVIKHQMPTHPPAPLTLQLFPSSQTPSSLNLDLSLSSHTQASLNAASRTMSSLTSKDSYISVA